ncbi:CHAT domain-containing tetratricopeptide repeat protein [Niveispirillum irakense]|uniref:CHAT domain-containing tetratricopeptide repeat protein n=1 Tax=Niveispirillum irakense TaxID=34011 RepID=UPI00042981F7|nr:CHAT domain-containing tetratricopeptide repeat protein [Niveispirillum irakense]
MDRRLLSSAAFAAGLTLILSGCADRPTTLAGATGGAIAVGQIGDGLQCRAQPVAIPGQSKLYDIFCGDWQEPGGQILVSPLGNILPAGDAGRQALREQSDRSAWANQLAFKASCQEPGWASTPSGEVMVQSCMLREGGWPHLGLVLAHDGQLYQADIIPSLADLLPQAAAALAGRPLPAPETSISTTLGPSVTPFGPGEIKRFEGAATQGRLANSLENFAEAEASYRRALETQSRILGSDSPALGETLMNLALEVSNQGRYEEADGLFARAEALVLRSFDRTMRARLTAYRGFHALSAGRTTEALGLARDATAARRALVAELEGNDPTGMNRSVLGNLAAARAELIHSLVLEGAIAIKLRQAAPAERAATEAQDIFDRTPGLPAWWQSRLLAQRGLAAAVAGDTRRGANLLTVALETNRKLFGDGWPVASLLLERGRVEQEGGMAAEALASFRSAFAMIQAADQPPVQLPMERIAPFMRAALAIAARNPASAPALHAEMFAASQLVREGAVGQTIGRASARFAADDPAIAAIIRDQQDASRIRDRLRLELATETAKPDNQRDAAREQTLRAQLDDAGRRAAQQDARLLEAFPDYARLSRFNTVPADKLAAALRDNEVMAIFALAENDGFGFLVSREGITAYQVPLGQTAATRQVGELRRAFTPRRDGLLPFDLAQSHALYQTLFSPVAEQVKAAGRIVFVSNGALSALPPAVLVTQAPSGRDYAQAAWLMRDHAIAIAPSVTAFLSLRQTGRKASAPLPFLGLAAPPFQGSPEDGMAALGRQCRTGGGVDPALLRALTPLPETADEIAQVGALLKAAPADLLTGATVTKAALRQRPLADYRVLYFATHGLLPGELRCQSEPGLALAPPTTATPDPANDGLLTASDVAMLRLNAELVVLSACNTAGGDGRFGGEALTGLAESFFFAGARNMLVTHWQVPSRPTVTLMTGTFAAMARSAQDRDAAAALAAAQRAALGLPGQAHPYFWGAFTLIGDGILPAGG